MDNYLSLLLSMTIPHCPIN